MQSVLTIDEEIPRGGGSFHVRDNSAIAKVLEGLDKAQVATSSRAVVLSYEWAMLWLTAAKDGQRGVS
jgi:hypothetical protein